MNRQNLVLDQWGAALREWLAGAIISGERRLLVVSGEHFQARDFAGQWWFSCPDRTARDDGVTRAGCWLGECAPEGIAALSPRQAIQRLGGELDLLVFDAWSGFDPDAFCALVGMVRGGGLVILLTPHLSEWSAFADPDYRRMLPHGYSSQQVCGHFLQRVAGSLPCMPGVAILDMEAGAWIVEPPLYVSAAERDSTATWNQYAAVTVLKRQDEHLDSLLAWSQQAPRRVAVLTADRGRGKSALLGRFASSLHQLWQLDVVVTSARGDAVTTLLAFAGNACRFVAPDALLEENFRENPAWVLVDEAAMLSVSLLKQLILRYPRIVLASTIHGYEGSGRGLSLKLFPWLQREVPDWRLLSLQGAMRWREGDPLESWMTQVFCLADDYPDLVSAEDECQVVAVSGADLASDSHLLHAVFGLLVSAHYRTTPSDLRDLLDGPNLRLWVLRSGGQVAGVCLVALEGPLADTDLVAGIMAGRRRPRGHLLPQVLAFHGHAPALLPVRCGRVVRIAVNPSLQGRGLGGRLLQEVCRALQAQGVEWSGSSFALEPAVLSFWQRNGFDVLRVGSAREAASGLPSCAVAMALPGATAETLHWLGLLRGQFCLEAESVLKRLLPREAAVLVPQVLAGQPGKQPDAGQLQARLLRFAGGGLPFESALGALQRWWPGVTADIRRRACAELPADCVDAALFVAETLQWLARAKKLQGRDDLLARLRVVVATAMSKTSP